MLKEKKLGLVGTSYGGLLQAAKSLKKMYGHHRGFNARTYLFETTLVPNKLGKKEVYVIGRDGMEEVDFDWKTMK